MPPPRTARCRTLQRGALSFRFPARLAMWITTSQRSAWAPQSSELDENRCHRRFLMRRSRIRWSRTHQASGVRPIPSSVRPGLATHRLWPPRTDRPSSPTSRGHPRVRLGRHPLPFGIRLLRACRLPTRVAPGALMASRPPADGGTPLSAHDEDCAVTSDKCSGGVLGDIALDWVGSTKFGRPNLARVRPRSG